MVQRGMENVRINNAAEMERSADEKNCCVGLTHHTTDWEECLKLKGLYKPLLQWTCKTRLYYCCLSMPRRKRTGRHKVGAHSMYVLIALLLPCRGIVPVPLCSPSSSSICQFGLVTWSCWKIAQKLGN